MLDGAMLMWFGLTIPSVLFVIVDIWRTTPEAKVLKWAFVILTLFTGPLGAFFYVLGCREPLRATHEKYIDVRWRQVLGSTMHCAAGDGIGIIVGAAIGAVLTVSFWPGFALEYALGFGFGWAFFQAFAMRDMAGGSYSKSLKMTFLPEFLSMNVLMAGMKLVSEFTMPYVESSNDPARPSFWFLMSMALIVGFVFAYPMNWWLVSNHLKHGMLTTRKPGPRAEEPEPGAMAGMAGMAGMAQPASPRKQVGTGTKAAMTVFSLAVLAVALTITRVFAPM